MRTAFVVLLLVSLAGAQTNTSAGAQTSSSDPAPSASGRSTAAPATTELKVAAGTHVPLALKHAVSTKAAKEGDAVYAETTFPVVADNRVLIPAGTYVQGKISHVKRGGHIKGRAEILIHFSTLIYPSGYTVMLPGAVDNVPGAEKTSVKDEEGTIRQDSQTGQKVGKIAEVGGTGALIGGLSRGGKGALIGAGIGGAVGTAIAMLGRGDDVKLPAGTTLEMIIQRDVLLDPGRDISEERWQRVRPRTAQ